MTACPLHSSTHLALPRPLPLPRLRSSLQWYWEVLVDRQPFRSVYEAAPGARQPLIWARPRNISQTAREQCELAGYVQEGLERPGNGQVGACCWTCAPAGVVVAC